MRLQGLPLLRRNPSPILSAKNPEIKNIGLVTTPSLIWIFSIQCFVWRSVLNILIMFDSFNPYITIKILFFHHTGSHLLEIHVLALYNTIMLWCVGNRMLHLDATFFTNLFQILIEYSLPLSVLRTLILFPHAFSTKALYTLKVSKTSDFSLRKYT